MCNYLYYDYSKQAVVQVFCHQEISTPCSSIKDWLEKQALLHGSTLKGRKEAFAKMMKVRKFLPAILSLDPVVIFFPTDTAKSDDNRWICWENIQTVQYSAKIATVYFKDGMVLELDHPRRIRRLMDNIFLYVRLMQNRQSVLI